MHSRCSGLIGRRVRRRSARPYVASRSHIIPTAVAIPNDCVVYSMRATCCCAFARDHMRTSDASRVGDGANDTSSIVTRIDLTVSNRTVGDARDDGDNIDDDVRV